MKLDALFKIFDAVMAVRETTKENKSDPARDRLTQTPASGIADQIEMRLANVVVAALKEAFDRDHARLELERSHLEEQRRRAEESIRMELHRQSADREIGRLRLLAGTALAGWIASVVLLATRVGDVSLVSQMILLAGSLLLLGSLAASFSAQTKISAHIPRVDSAPETGSVGSAALWLLIAGLALAALSLLF
jgi:hypothetical protein